MPVNCAQCTAPLEEGASVCAHCGAPFAAPAPAAYVPAFSMGSDLEGIGGWLILVAIGLTTSPLRSIHGIYSTLHVLYGSQFQHTLSIHPGLAVLILYEAVTNSFFFIALIALNYLFYRRKRVFPGLMITFLALNATLLLIDHVVAIQFHPGASVFNVMGAVVGAAIWIPYYIQSERVKATFVR